MGPPVRRQASAGRRALLAGGGLAAAWAAAFHGTDLAFFPLVAAGGIVTGIAGVWVRRAGGARLPSVAMRPRHVALALAAAGLHLVAAYALVDLGTLLVPSWAPTRAEVYGPPGELPLGWALLVGGVVTAPLEEVYWRGAVHPLLVARARRRGRLARLAGLSPAVGALVYGAFHLVTGHAALVAAALLGGWVWCWLAERTGTVGASMLAHAVWASSMLLVPPV